MPAAVIYPATEIGAVTSDSFCRCNSNVFEAIKRYDDWKERLNHKQSTK